MRGLMNGLLRVGQAQATRRGHLKTCHRHAATAPSLPPCDMQPPPYEGPPFEEVMKSRKTTQAPSLVKFYDTPLLLHAGHRQYLWDHTGRRYLDYFGGIVTVSVGHCHPTVVEATTAQMKKLWHTSCIYMNPSCAEYAKALTDTLPGDLKVVFFTNSGSESNDLALLMCRLYTGQFDAVSFRNSYHGASPYTMGLTGLSVSKFPLANGFGCHHAMNPDPYRGLWGGHRDSPVQSLRADEATLTEGVCSSAGHYLRQLQELLNYCVAKGKPAAFFAESIQGVGACVQYPLGYLKGAYEMIRDRGGLCVADEVQTGFGRTGEHFWGFEGHGVIPDIVTMAKGIGNGYPLGAVVTTPEVAEVVTRGFHFNTFGGNALGAAVGHAVLKTMKEENVQKVSKDMGTKLLVELGKLRDVFDTLGDVRGKGLMIGVELVESQGCHTPMSPNRFSAIWEHCREMGLLLGKGGVQYGNVFRIKPPMVITDEDVNFSLEVLKTALEADRKAHAQ